MSRPKMSTGAITDDAICRIIESALPKVGKGGVSSSMSLQADLGVDSIGLMSIVFLLEEKTGIDAFDHVQQFIGARYVSDLITIVRQG
jgi:acyl carrier protein